MKKKPARLTVLQAVDNLSHLADLDIEKAEWGDPAKAQENQEAIRETFRTLTAYLQHLYQKEKTELSNPQTQKGLQAMMQLADEAVDKVGKYTHLFKGVHEQEEPIQEFKQLQHFYLAKVFSRVKNEKGEEAWEVEGAEKGFDEERQALKDLESVQQDGEYELFFIAKEDGTLFFSPNLLRHVRMVGNFDESLLSPDKEDLFRRAFVIFDRDLHVSAQEILQEGKNLFDRFYREAFRHKDQIGPSLLISATMALMLAANPKNLVHNTRAKSCSGYFLDFQKYLRLSLESEEHTRQTPFHELCTKILYFLCNALFLRMGARHEILSLVKNLTEKRAHEMDSIWSSLASVESALRTELRKMPSGPLMKAMAQFRQGEEKHGFDPLVQKNPPSLIFTISSTALHTSVIHLPAPVHQDFIDRAVIVPEFKGYLRSLGTSKHLFINLQDRTSWKEYARCTALEDLSRHSEFTDPFRLITLAKKTDFYLQTGEYVDLGDALEFCRMTAQQILSGTECGFYFPQGLLSPKMVEETVHFIHEQFFETKPHLTRKERLDLIEILYQFLVLRIVDAEKPDVLSFSCKDGVDTGAAMAAGFYGITRMLSTNKPWTEEDKNFFLFAFFGPALLVRNRSISPPIFQRTLSALDHFESVMVEKRDKVLSACRSFFPELPFDEIKISEVA